MNENTCSCSDCNADIGESPISKTSGSGISNEHQIQAYLHCGLCLKELPDELSPSEYQQIEVGWTPAGLQIWCKRHQCNIVHIDFEGQQHPANTTRRLQKESSTDPAN